MDNVNLSNTPSEEEEKQTPRWYALRDLKRANAKQPGYKELGEMGIEVFTPMKWVSRIVKGKRKKMRVPVLSDLLFVRSDRETLDPIIESKPSLQYRYARGGYCRPMIIDAAEMERFIRATAGVNNPHYYSPDDLSALTIGGSVRITDGPLEGIEAKIVKIRGARKKRILVTVPGLIAAVVEVDTASVEAIE